MEGGTVKLLAVAGLDASGKELSAFVSPCFVKETSALATIQGATNAVQVESSRLGTSTLIGQGAGRFPTANSCVSDIIAIARGTIAPQVRSSALAAPAGDDDASRALSPLLPSRRPRTRSKRRVEIKRATRIRRPIRIKSLRIACQPHVVIRPHRRCCSCAPIGGFGVWMTTAAAAAALARAARARMGDDSRSPRRTATGSSSRTTLSRSSTCASSTPTASGSSRTSARSVRSTASRSTRCSRSVDGLCRVSSSMVAVLSSLVPYVLSASPDGVRLLRMESRDGARL